MQIKYTEQLHILLNQRASIQKQLRDSISIFDEKKQPISIALSLKLAENEDPRGLFVKGNAHTVNGFLRTDLVKAEYFMKKAAEQGLDIAQKKLGDLYADGEGSFPRNPGKAVFWLNEAAESSRIGLRGEWDEELAYRYATGNGIPKSLGNAVYWKVLRPLLPLTFKDLIAEVLSLNGNETKSELIKKYITAGLGLFAGLLYLAFINTIYLFLLIGIYLSSGFLSIFQKNTGKPN